MLMWEIHSHTHGLQVEDYYIHFHIHYVVLWVILSRIHILSLFSLLPVGNGSHRDYNYMYRELYSIKVVSIIVHFPEKSNVVSSVVPAHVPDRGH